MFSQLFPVVVLAAAANAQFPLPASFTTVIKSPIDSNINISYKTPDPGTCTTLFTSQKQYSGYITLPPYTLAPIQQNYSINTFFWFVEARESPETAPLTIWLNGGPGTSSMTGLFLENGPCEVVQMLDGTYGTQGRMWGWDRSSNVLYVDQPAQVGFSYDQLTNFTVNLFDGTYNQPPEPLPQGTPAYAWLNGTFGSNNPGATTNTTEIAAQAVWHFLQGWLSAFPKYNPGIYPNSTRTAATGVNLFTESYGGIYGPNFANFFQQQNAKRLKGGLPRNSTLEIYLKSVGIVNGLVDELIQAPYYPKFANNNTYGIEAITSTDLLNALNDFSKYGGCSDSIIACRNAMLRQDRHGEGDVENVNSLCTQAQTACQTVQNYYYNYGHSPYDIRQAVPDPFPSQGYQEYLNMQTVQQAIGAAINYTDTSVAVYDALTSTGDVIRGTQITALAHLLNTGVRVALIYGDADYICNWYGGEAVSFSIASQISTYATNFAAAGYADIIVNSSYIGGAVRQFGNLSFSRIYDAGHLVPAYQPETAFTVFTRVIDGTDIGTGEVIDISTFATTGDANATHTNDVPDEASPTCWVRAINETCTSEQQDMMKLGEGVVLNGVWYEEESDYTPPASSVVAGVPGTLPSSSLTPSATYTWGSSSAPPVGVYTATATPTMGAASAFQVPLTRVGMVALIFGLL